jgi:hypothetical protein
MQTIVGYFLIIVGAAMEIVSVLVWLGVLKPAAEMKSLRAATFWDVVLELMRRAPWPAAVGLILIYAGLKMIGVVLPF